MALIIAYVEVILLQYNFVLFVIIRPMHVCYMDHFVELLSVIILALNFILWLKGVVLSKINH
jgi:hypothetical protein